MTVRDIRLNSVTTIYFLMIPTSMKEKNQNRNKAKEDVIYEKRFWFKIFPARTVV